MSAYRAGLRLGAALACSALLAACAVQPPKPSPRPAEVIPLPTPPPVTTAAPTGKSTAEPWASLVASFVLPDCADDPLIDARKALFTRNPKAFEDLLQRSLPLMMYVQKQLDGADIPGEFVMLPLLESSYDPAEPSRNGDAAGMWQLMPRTAKLRGLRMTHAYDGRRDPVASTRVAVVILTNLHRKFGDWRVVDMAYNAGPWAITKALRKHPDIGGKPIPDLPVSAITRAHLAKLMALSCIVREPARFHVTLPEPTPGEELEAVQVPARSHLADIAAMAGISDAALRALNPGYRGHEIPAHSPRSLLLPSPAARTLAAALAIQSSESVAQVNPGESTSGADADDSPPLPVEPAPPPGDPVSRAPAKQHATRHRVRAGESLWSIARRFHVSVRDLKRWNGLHGNVIHPGDLLRVRR